MLVESDWDVRDAVDVVERSIPAQRAMDQQHLNGGATGCHGAIRVTVPESPSFLGVQFSQ